MPFQSPISRSRRPGSPLVLVTFAAIGMGFPPANAEDQAAVSREELVARWDLDRNGTIDESEAAIARARIRRARMELESRSTIDPLTGRPRGAVVETPAGPESPPAEPPPAARRSEDDAALPGTRVPPTTRPGLPAVAAPSTKRNGAGEEGSGRSSAGRESPRPPSWARGGAVTGGVRAGAPAARPGYGATAPESGRGDPDATRGTKPGSSAQRLSGGLLPRPLGGAPRSQPMSGPGAAGRPVPPTSALPPRPRVTAEDIGGF